MSSWQIDSVSIEKLYYKSKFIAVIAIWQDSCNVTTLMNIHYTA